MDEILTKKYRQFLQSGFEHTGSIENPSIFLDTRLEGISICAQASSNYLNIYIDVRDGRITEIKYLCLCDPIANVVVETLCDLVKGMSIDEVKSVTEEAFFQEIGCDSEPLSKKVTGIIELLNRGIQRYEED
jgi:NifU-like protein involved in Fe-S cluster formation